MALWILTSSRQVKDKEVLWVTSDLLLSLLLRVLGDDLARCDAHLGGLEGLQATPHGPLEDLLHFILTLVNAEVAPAVLVTVLIGPQKEAESKESFHSCVSVFADCWHYYFLNLGQNNN